MKKEFKNIIWIVLTISFIFVVCFWIIYHYCIGCFNPMARYQECQSLFTVHCASCQNLNWTGIHEANKELQGCDKLPWYDNVPKNLNDCSGLKQFCINFLPISG